MTRLLEYGKLSEPTVVAAHEGRGPGEEPVGVRIPFGSGLTECRK